MNAGMNALLIENLKKLKLSTMIRNLQGLIRQAKQDKLSYEEFLLNLSEAEVQARQENGRKRRLREAKFPILKPMETFNFDAAQELDVRLMKELSNCDYVKKSRNIIFMGKSTLKKAAILFLWAKAAPAKPILPPLWAWKPASREYGLALSPAAALPMSSLKPEMKSSWVVRSNAMPVMGCSLLMNWDMSLSPRKGLSLSSKYWLNVTKENRS
jgi:hypothetical protein